MKRTGPFSWLLAHIHAVAWGLWRDLVDIINCFRHPVLPKRTRQGNLPYRSAEDAALFRELDALLDPCRLVPEPRRPTP